MIFCKVLTESLTLAKINFNVIKTNTPAASAPAIGNPTSPTRVKKSIVSPIT
jgi:hypothetical protein